MFVEPVAEAPGSLSRSDLLVIDMNSPVSG
jgi:hypothetical protein